MDRPGRDVLQAALPAYEVGDELGRGAFGVVWAGRHTQLGREVAIKQLPQAFAADETVRGRFVDEARTVAALDHPHIVPVYDFVENSTACLLIMERCADSVGDRFKASGIATDEACAAVLACLAALDHAHERGVLHRDVKPENLMYDRAGTVKLADFGIARALHHDVRRTAAGMVVGTPAYMSPEQVRGDTLSPASDVYAVAVMAYELLTGSLPFPESDSVNGLLAHHLVTEPLPMLSTRPELPGSIGTAIDRALAKDIAVRPATALEFATELSAACVGAFGSGWLRRRRFTLHWPDVVAENERSGPAAPRTGTIVVQARHTGHEVITPSAALAGDVQPLDFPPPGAPPSRPPPQPGGSLPPTGPAPPPPVPPSVPRPPAASTPGSRAPLIIGIAVVAVVLAIVAVAASIVLVTADDPDAGGTGASAVVDENDAQRGSGAENDDDPNDASTDPSETDPIQTDPTLTDPTLTETNPVDSVVPTTELAAPDQTEEAESPPTDDGTDGSTSQGIGIRPPDYDPNDASEALRPTPCPVEQPRHACITVGVGLNSDTGDINFSYFTQGFVPDIDGGGDRVHFYFDTAVDGDENAAGTAVEGAAYIEWDQPAFVNGDVDVPAGRTMFTVADAEAVDARHLCVIVADADGVAMPGTGNCAPIYQLWDIPTLQAQIDRPAGRWIGGCGAGVSAIVPAEWQSVDLTTTAPAEAATQLFPGDGGAATEVFQSLVDEGAVLFATSADVTVVISTFDGAISMSATPAETDAFFAALGMSPESTVPTLVNDRQISTSTSEDAATVTIRYRIPDFAVAYEVAVSAPSGTDITEFSRRLAGTVVGC